MTSSVLSTEEAAIQRRLDYAEFLWWNMHHSYLPGNKAFSLTSYFDDSGSDDLSPMTTIGGPMMSKDAFIEFSGHWDKVLRFHRICAPLHMKDFVRPHGRYIGMHREMKLALFNDVCILVNKYKLVSMSVSVSGSDFNAQLSEEVRRSVIGPYGLAFFFVVMGNQGYSEVSLVHPAEVISYIIDSGFSYAEQLVAVHAAIIRVRREKGRSCFVGSLTQDTDDRVPALQAADVIAWSARRRELGQLTDEFAPLEAVLSTNHTHYPFPKGGLKMFSRPINNWLATGVIPTLTDIFR